VSTPDRAGGRHPVDVLLGVYNVGVTRDALVREVASGHPLAGCRAVPFAPGLRAALVLPAVLVVTPDDKVTVVPGCLLTAQAAAAWHADTPPHRDRPVRTGRARYPASVNRRRVGDFLVIALIMGIPLAVAGGGVYYLAQQLAGTPGTATVNECHLTGTRASRGYVCTGTWVIDGTAAGRGTINGAVSGDEGKQLDVAIRGGAAYTTSLGTPITLIALGGGIALLFGFIIWRGRRAKVPR
jgi:hypothetical protein